MEDTSRKEQVTQCDGICSTSMGDTKRQCSYLSVRVPACILEAHLRLSIVPCTSPSLWHLAAQLASPSRYVLFAPQLTPCLCAAQWLSPLVDTLQILLSYTPTYSRETKFLLAALSGLLLSLIQNSSLQSLELWQTVFFILLLSYQLPQPTLLTLSYVGSHPGVKLPGWKTGGF